jgi:hypothetical protein
MNAEDRVRDMLSDTRNWLSSAFTIRTAIREFRMTATQCSHISRRRTARDPLDAPAAECYPRSALIECCDSPMRATGG